MQTSAQRKKRIVEGVAFHLGEPIVGGRLARIWWVVLLRAIAAMIFGLLALAWPSHSALVLVTLFGGYALVDGFTALAISARGRGSPAHGWLILAGAASMAAGALALLRPALMVLVLIGVLGAWLILRGFTEIAGEASVRDSEKRDWSILLNGLMSALFGFGLILAPRVGGLGLIWAVGGWAILHGLLMVPTALRLRRSIW